MRDFLASILGEYVPVTYQAIGYDLDGTPLLTDVIPNGVAGVDWLYVLSGIAFLLSVYCVFRVIGGWLCKIS